MHRKHQVWIFPRKCFTMQFFTPTLDLDNVPIEDQFHFLHSHLKDSCCHKSGIIDYRLVWRLSLRLWCSFLLLLLLSHGYIYWGGLLVMWSHASAVHCCNFQILYWKYIISKLLKFKIVHDEPLLWIYQFQYICL